jgi:hypothetical protein
MQQSIDNLRWDQVPLRWIDIPKQDQVAQENAPMRTKAIYQALPVQPVGPPQQQMRNVATIVTLTLHDKSLAPDHFFRWAEFYRESEDPTGHRMLKPQIVNFTQSVARIENDIDKEIIVKDLSQPMGKRQFHLKASILEDLENAVQIASLNEEIHIFRRPPHVCVKFQREAPAQKK